MEIWFCGAMGAVVEQLPTILQVLEDIAGDELSKKLDPFTSSYIAGLGCENIFYVLRDDEKQKRQLLPGSPSLGKYFRGQREYFPSCYASIHRGLSDSEVLIERLRLCEFNILLSTHPVVNDFMDAGFHIDVEGLAQHYGIATSILDLTNNKWTAAFFACTNYLNGSYQILDVSYKTKMGILYMLEEHPVEGFPEICVFGAQPLERPTRQNAFGVRLEEQQNFNDLPGLRIIPFRHDEEADQIIYDMFYRSNRLFPDDLFVDVVNQLKQESIISFDAAALCHETYYQQLTNKEFSMLFSQTGMTIAPSCNVTLPREQLQKVCEHWWKYGKKKMEKRMKVINVQKINL